MECRGATITIGLASAALLSLMLMSPLLYAPGSFTDLGGTAGIMDRPWSMSELPYCLGDLFCHQDPGRSPFMNGNQMPICFRDVGILVGLTIGLVYCGVSNTVPRNRVHLALALALCSVTVIEWTVENFMELHESVRLVSGIISGFGAGTIGSYLVRSVYEKG